MLSYGRNDREMTDIESQESIDSLQAKLKALTQYAHIISHDVSGPISNLSILLNFLLEDKISLEEYQSLVKKTLASLELTIDNLNWSVRIERLEDLPIQELNIQETFNVVLDMYNAYIQDLSITITSSFDVQKIKHNKTIIISLFSNLLSNSIKYRNHKAPLLIDVSTFEREGEIILKFQDNGVGVKPEDKELIFQKFGQSAPKRDGSGLGLYLCKTMLPIFGDDIEVGGLPNQGACFTITFQNKSV